MATATAGSPIPVISSSPPLPLLPSSPIRAIGDSAGYRLNDEWRTPPSSPSGLLLAGNLSVEGTQKKEVKEKKLLKPGSRAAPIPEGAVTVFRSAREVVGDCGAESREIAEDKEKMAMAEQKTGDAGETQVEAKANAKPKQRRKRSDGSKLRLDKKPVQRKSVDKQVSPAPQLEASREAQTFQMPAGYRESEETSRYFKKHVDEEEPKQRPLQDEEHPILDDSSPIVLREAATARLNANIGFVSDAAQHQVQLKSGKQDDSPSTLSPAEVITGSTSKKKRREKKDTAIKKKPSVRKETVTITAKAIANVKVPDRPEGDVELQASPDTSSPPDLQKFGITQVHKPHIASYTAKKPAAIKGAAESKVTKRKKPATKAKKVTTIEHKLRSPESAMRRFQRQEFLFGTSSQLFSEEDPASMREMQLAIKASELDGDDEKLPNDPDSYSGTKLPKASRMLWLAGAQGGGEEFSVLQRPAPEPPKALHEDSNTTESLHEVNAGDIPTLGRVDLVEQHSGIGSDPGQGNVQLSTKNTGSRLRLSSAPPGRKMLLCLGAPRTQPPISGHATVSEILSSHVTSQSKHISTHTAANADNRKKTKKKSNDKPEPEPNPTEKNQAAAVTANDSRPPAKRPRGRPRKDAAADPSTPAKLARKRKKAAIGNSTAEDRLRQPDEQGFVPIDDIEDDDPPSPSPPRRNSPSVLAKLDLSGPLAVAQSVPEIAEGLAESHQTAADEALNEAESLARARIRAEAKAEARKKLFAQITKAIKSAPRTTDPKHPSWWEKMLLYDPIVIEDLTAWLNDGALEAAAAPLSTDGAAAMSTVEGEGERNENSKCALPLKPAVVQKWCEANSVCCLWREGLRGGVKTKY